MKRQPATSVLVSIIYLFNRLQTTEKQVFPVSEEKAPFIKEIEEQHCAYKSCTHRHTSEDDDNKPPWVFYCILFVLYI